MKLAFIFLSALLLVQCSRSNDPDPILPPPQESLAAGWSKIQFPSQERILDIVFRNSLNGYAVAGSSIFQSSDGGKTWQKIYSSSGSLVNIAVGNTMNAIFTGSGNRVLITRDAGKSFDSVALADQMIHDAFFTGPSTAYAVGHKIWKTTDAGKSWTNLSAFANNSPTTSRTLFFLNEQSGWTTGDRVLKTVNGGIEWTTNPGITFGYNMGSIHFPDNVTGYITDANSVNKTTDGGLTFSKVYTPSSSYYHDLHFLSSQTGYLTDHLYILKTIDGGNTWVKEVTLAHDSGIELIELHFTDASHGWAAGSGGYILRYEK